MHPARTRRRQAWCASLGDSDISEISDTFDGGVVVERVFDYSDLVPTTATLRAEILSVLADLEPDAMSGDAAAALVRDFATIEKAAATGRMFAALRVAKTDAWRGEGHGSAADWLAAQAGITVREAAAQLGTAKQADGLPETKKAMRKGKLSPVQAGAVAGAATADPSAEDSLLDAAEQDTTAKLKEQAAKTKAAATDSDTRERRIRAERSLRTRTDAEGAFCLSLRGPAVDGVRLQALLRPFEEQIFRTGRTDGMRDTFENRSYDAFFALIAHLQHQAGAGAGSGPTEAASGAPTPPCPASTPTPGATTPRSRPPGGNNTKVIVLIDHAALARGNTIAGETCEVAGLGPISVTTAKHLMADAFLAAVITKGRDVINVAHLGRGLNAHQRTAIEATGLRCSNRACNKTIAIQIDHRHPYADDPQTKLDNQDPLCPNCHRQKTHHGWHLEPGTGPRRFLPPVRPPARSPARSPAGAGAGGGQGASGPDLAAGT